MIVLWAKWSRQRWCTGTEFTRCSRTEQVHLRPCGWALPPPSPLSCTTAFHNRDMLAFLTSPCSLMAQWHSSCLLNLLTILPALWPYSFPRYQLLAVFFLPWPRQHALFSHFSQTSPTFLIPHPPIASNMPTLSKSSIEIWRHKVVSSFKWCHAFLIRSNLHNPHWPIRGKEAGRTSPNLHPDSRAPIRPPVSCCSPPRKIFSPLIGALLQQVHAHLWSWGSTGIGNAALFNVRGRNQWWIKAWRCRRSLLYSMPSKGERAHLPVSKEGRDGPWNRYFVAE